MVSKKPTKSSSSKTAGASKLAPAKEVKAKADGKKAAAKNTKPAEEPEESWPESELGGATITATLAKQWYRLGQNELNSLQHQVLESPNDPTKEMHLYKACEVERAAWRKYGGPARWNWSLNRMKETYKKTHPGKKFPEPRWISKKLCSGCSRNVWETSYGYYLNPVKCRNCEMSESSRFGGHGHGHGHDPLGLFHCCD
ncbi:hypothetical protein BV25DRAFT_1827290 [Artomyces pyxidatus]|uniref:Uncharacterized protein n=1 Tax=Artomyces pyxidatus TaxID=48021 RepID=A0ACB8SWS2_9AGAM|nr:hypothetical protein BV25DRAFT_1827290 [Artomyces pyxidatus]